MSVPGAGAEPPSSELSHAAGIGEIMAAAPLRERLPLSRPMWWFLWDYHVTEFRRARWMICTSAR
ncbi:MAG: hypothetical protein ACLPKI_01690 [Streptosporangiaceae bacterium]